MKSSMDTLDLNSPILLMVGQIILFILFTALLIKRDKIFRGTKNEFLKFLHDSIQDVKISFKNPLSSVFFPILVALIIYFAYRIFVQSSVTQINPDFETLVFIIVLMTVSGPIAEEVIQCLTLSVAFVGEKHIFKKYSFQETNLRIYGIMFTVMILDAIYMAYFHNNKDITSFFIRMFCFVIYGFLYIINDRNIVPPIIAHSTWNLLVVLGSLTN
jgi:membrane protease YdiL (CAAX protease family)